MDSNSTLTPELMDRYLRGELSPEEIAGLGASEMRVLGRIQGAVDDMYSLRGENLSAPIVGRNIVCRDAAMRPSIPARYKYVGVPLVLAAAIAIAIAGIKYIPNLTHTTQSTPTSKTYSTTTAQRLNVTLADGSIVNLAPMTTLRVSGRSVDLQGEAVFTVTQHTKDPFTVRTGNTITRVLGTTFGIRAYDANIRVAVSDGRVSVGDNASLSAGDVATVTSDTVIIARNTNVAELLSWTTGHLVFRDAPLGDVLATLSRWYGVDLKLSSQALVAERVTITFNNHSLSEVVEHLSRTTGLTPTRSGSTVVFSR